MITKSSQKGPHGPWRHGETTRSGGYLRGVILPSAYVLSAFSS